MSTPKGRGTHAWDPWDDNTPPSSRSNTQRQPDKRRSKTSQWENAWGPPLPQPRQNTPALHQPGLTPSHSRPGLAVKSTVDLNIFHKYSLVSRSSGSDPNSLVNRPAQLEFWAYTLKNIDSFTATLNSGGTPTNTEHILACFRKLREGLTSSATPTPLAVQIYEKSVDISLYAENHPEMVKSLAALVGWLYPAFDQSENSCGDAGSSGDLLRRRGEMTALYLLYYVVQTGKRDDFSPPKGLTFTHTRDVVRIYGALSDVERGDQRVRNVVKLWECVRGRGVDWVGIAGVVGKWDSGGGEMRIFKILLAPLRAHILGILTKCYFTLPLDVAQRWLLFGDGERGAVVGFLGEVLKGEGVGAEGEVVTLRVARRGKKVG